jgi:hypothetical protein
MTPHDRSSRAAARLALLAALAFAGCAGRAGVPADAVPAAPPPASADAEPLTPGIVPLTLEQEREVD